MKLKKYDNETSPTAYFRGGKDPLISLGKSGMVRFNRSATELLGLKPETRVLFHHDEENRSDWYLEITTDVNGFKLKEAKDGVVYFSRSSLISQIAKSLAHNAKTSFKLKIIDRPKIFIEKTLYLLRELK